MTPWPLQGLSSLSHQSDVTAVNQSLWPTAALPQPSSECVLHVTLPCSVYTHTQRETHTQRLHCIFVSTSQALQAAWCVRICSPADVFSDAWASVTDLGLSWCTTWLAGADSWPLPAHNEYSTKLKGGVDKSMDELSSTWMQSLAFTRWSYALWWI